MINIEKLTDLIHRWSSVNRFSQCCILLPENVAEHTAHVELVALLLARALESEGYEIDFRKLYEIITIHDLDEVVVGDIPRTTKNYSKQLKQLFEAVEKESMKVLCDSFDLPKDFYDLWLTSKDRSLEGIILKLADLLVVYIKAKIEVDLLGNVTMNEVLENVLNYFREDLIMILAEIPPLKEVVKAIVKKELVDGRIR